MSFNVGQVAAILNRETAPTRTNVLWGHILNPSFPDVIQVKYWDDISGTWLPLTDPTRQYWLRAVIDNTITTPPASPTEGDRYIVAAGSSGVWSGQDDKVAEYRSAAWTFETPLDGYIVNVRTQTDQLEEYVGTYGAGGAWGTLDFTQPFAPASFQLRSEKDAALGYVGLDASSLILDSFIDHDNLTYNPSSPTSWPGGTTKIKSALDHLILNLAGGFAGVSFVADITSRDAISTPATGQGAYVTDASSDSEIGFGAAFYTYNGSAWVLISAVNAIGTSLDAKSSVRVATTANITLSGTQTIDGISVIAGNRVLVKNQSTASENGIYVCAAGAWSRSVDADINEEVTSGMYMFVEEGTANQDTGWILSTDDPIIVDTTNLTFEKFINSVTVLYGTSGQLPRTNAGGTNFDYGADLVYDGSTLTVTGDVSATSFNSVALTTGGVATNFLNETGAYSVPTGLIANLEDSGANVQNSAAGTGAFTWDNIILNISGISANGLSITAVGTDLEIFSNDVIRMNNRVHPVTSSTLGLGGTARSWLNLYVDDIILGATSTTGATRTITASGVLADIGITLTPKGTGNIILGTMTLDSDQAIGAGQDNYVLTYDNGTGLVSLEAAAGFSVTNETNNRVVTSVSAGVGNAEEFLTFDPTGTGLSVTVDGSGSTSTELASFTKTAGAETDGIGGYITINVEDHTGGLQPMKLHHILSDNTNATEDSTIYMSAWDTGIEEHFFMVSGDNTNSQFNLPSRSVIIGGNFSITSARTHTTMVGYENNATNIENSLFGASIFSSGLGGTSIGYNTVINDHYGIAIGRQTRIDTQGGMIIGYSSDGTSVINTVGDSFMINFDQTVSTHFKKEVVAATGDEVLNTFNGIVNKATSGNYTGILLNVTETAAPGTADLLLDLQVGSVSQFNIGNGGKVLGKAYGAGSITGTATYSLAVDASGNFIEEALGGAPAYGAVNQIPYMNGAGAFIYNSSFTYNGDILALTSSAPNIELEGSAAATIMSLKRTSANIADALGTLNFYWNGNQVASVTGIARNDDTNDDEADLRFATASSGGVLQFTYQRTTGDWDYDGHDLLGIGQITLNDAANIVFNSTTGTKIGTATTQKLGFYNATPIVQPTALTAADAATVDATYGSEESGVINNLRTRIDELETKLQALGLVA
jgi:hypothetical protein